MAISRCRCKPIFGPPDFGCVGRDSLKRKAAVLRPPLPFPKALPLAAPNSDCFLSAKNRTCHLERCPGDPGDRGNCLLLPLGRGSRRRRRNQCLALGKTGFALRHFFRALFHHEFELANRDAIVAQVLLLRLENFAGAVQLFPCGSKRGIITERNPAGWPVKKRWCRTGRRCDGGGTSGRASGL